MSDKLGFSQDYDKLVEKPITDDEDVTDNHRDNAPVPIDSDIANEPKKLLVLVDGSEHANRAFTKALSMKREQDLLYICHAVTIMNPAYYQELSHLSSHLADDYIKQLQEQGKNTCKYYVATCQQHKIPNCHQVVISSTEPKDDVLAFVQEKGIDTIFVGPRGLSRVKRMLLGSFSHYIISHATCDVVVVK
eukprot:c32466_g1_i1.p1 GENE.c32466_g1_i1~~c32466_g1_i1.p1  ORF type:complete len:199 (+),score=48.75 c32466_g1_i1:27-599(+)